MSHCLSKPLVTSVKKQKACGNTEQIWQHPWREKELMFQVENPSSEQVHIPQSGLRKTDTHNPLAGVKDPNLCHYTPSWNFSETSEM